MKTARPWKFGRGFEVAVYTDITDAELEALLANYAVGAALSFKGIAEGVENSNFLLETEAGRFILTIYEKRVARADLPYFMALTQHLADKGFPAPRPQATRAGALLSEVRGKPCALIQFLTGVSPRAPNAAQCRAIGAGLAQMHLALADFTGHRANSLGLKDWGALIRPRMDAVEALAPGLAQHIAADLDTLESVWPHGLPQGAIHADLFPDNAFFLADKLVGVFDFYFACTDALAYDLAVNLNAWCFEADRSFNLTKGMALIAGYQSIRPLTIEERAALPILARGAAMRFFATRLVDWSATPAGALVRPKNPLDYADRLAFHRRAVGPGDYGA
jgi:homoserine kinase type II